MLFVLDYDMTMFWMFCMDFVGLSMVCHLIRMHVIFQLKVVTWALENRITLRCFRRRLGCDTNYVYYYREDPETNAVESVLFIHLQSYILWRAFPHVLMIDSTYKTNKYKMSFVQMVGVTSTKLSFCVGHAYMSSEREENYTWVLERLKETLEDQRIEPRVIVTNRELVLMNACQQVFPYATQLLCRWHIFECILKHCKPSYLFDREWHEFEFYKQLSSSHRMNQLMTQTMINYFDYDFQTCK